MREPTAKELKFMLWAVEGAAIFSTCGKAKYMAIVLDPHGFVLGTGYNGSPSGWVHCVDGGCPRFQNATPSGTNYDDCVAIHAEANALLVADPARRRGGTLLVNGLCCLTCAKLISNSGLARVVCLEGRNAADGDAVRWFFENSGVDLVEVEQAWLAA